MSGRESSQQPFWLSRLLENFSYVGTNVFLDKVWKTIFDNLSKYPEFNSGPFSINDDDIKTYIRRRLACLLPDSDSHYGFDQISIWGSLMTSSLTVSNDNLRRVVDMENSQDPSPSVRKAAPSSRSFFVCSWAMSVSEFDILHNYLKDEEKTFHELVTWDTFIADKELGLDDRIIIRYIGSCLLSEWPINLAADYYEQTKDDRSGILAEFLPAVACVLPKVAEACQCYRIRDITTSAEDEEGFHELVYSILIEFFGAPFVINRHPNGNVSKCLTERIHIRTKLDLGFDHGVQGPGCPSTVISKLKVHFETGMDFIALDQEVINTDNDISQPNRVKQFLLNRSIPAFNKNNRSIMAFAARGLHINDYSRGCHYLYDLDPGINLIDSMIRDVKNLHSYVIDDMPFPYYYLAPWPKFTCLDGAIAFMWDYFEIIRPLVWVTLGKGMAACVIRKCECYGIYTTDAYLGEIGKPVIRRFGNHSFIHVPLLDPSRCRYGVDYVDEAALKFMQTSLWNAMLIAKIVMRALDDPELIEEEMAIQTDSEKWSSDNDTSTSEESRHTTTSEENRFRSAKTVVCGPTEVKELNESKAICRSAMQLYREFLATNTGRAFSAELEKDWGVLDKVVDKEPLFIF